MQHEVYTEFPLAQNAALLMPEPRRAGELLPELFRRYVERIAAASERPVPLVDEATASKLGVSIVAVKSAGSTIAPADWASLPPTAMAPLPS